MPDTGQKTKPRDHSRVDAFNALNHTNDLSYIGTLTSPFLGHAVAVNPPRRLQISLRFKF